MYLKWRLSGSDEDPVTSLAAEARRLAWLENYLLVPRVVGLWSGDSRELLLTEAVEGLPASHADVLADQAVLADVRRSALEALSSPTPEEAAMGETTADICAQAEARVHAGLVDETDFEPIFLGRSSQDSVAELKRLRPREPDCPTLVHGDLCLPNIIVKDGKLAGAHNLADSLAIDVYELVHAGRRVLLGQNPPILQ
jgi:aminoglycoside phosphotransferase